MGKEYTDTTSEINFGVSYENDRIRIVIERV